jgi:competence protein ComEC
VPANLLAEPAVAPATILGVMTACVAPWWTTGARWIAQVAALPCGWLVWVARTFARMPGAAVTWPTGVVGALDLALVVLVFVVGLRLLARARGEGGS